MDEHLKDVAESAGLTEDEIELAEALQDGDYESFQNIERQSVRVWLKPGRKKVVPMARFFAICGVIHVASLRREEAEEIAAENKAEEITAEDAEAAEKKATPLPDGATLEAEKNAAPDETPLEDLAYPEIVKLAETLGYNEIMGSTPRNKSTALLTEFIEEQREKEENK